MTADAETQAYIAGLFDIPVSFLDGTNTYENYTRWTKRIRNELMQHHIAELKKYKKKPVEIYAVELTQENLSAVAVWCGGTIVGREDWDYDQGAWRYINPKTQDPGYVFPSDSDEAHTLDLHIPRLVIFTLEGAMAFRPGWKVIEGVEGEYYGCKQSVFEKSYDEVAQ